MRSQCVETELGSLDDLSLQLFLAARASLLADKKALGQVREKHSLRLRAAAEVSDKY